MKTAMKKKKGLFTSDRIEPREEYKEGGPQPLFSSPVRPGNPFPQLSNAPPTNQCAAPAASIIGPKGGGALPGVGEYSTIREKEAAQRSLC